MVVALIQWRKLSGLSSHLPPAWRCEIWGHVAQIRSISSTGKNSHTSCWAWEQPGPWVVSGWVLGVILDILFFTCPQNHFWRVWESQRQWQSVYPRATQVAQEKCARKCIILVLIGMRMDFQRLCQKELQNKARLCCPIQLGVDSSKFTQPPHHQNTKTQGIEFPSCMWTLIALHLMQGVIFITSPHYLLCVLAGWEIGLEIITVLLGWVAMGSGQGSACRDPPLSSQLSLIPWWQRHIKHSVLLSSGLRKKGDRKRLTERKNKTKIIIKNK